MLHTHDRLIIPDIEIPFPRNGHAKTHVAHQMTKKWAVAHAVMPPRLAAAFLDDLGYTNLIAGYYVGAPLPVLVAINDFSLWFFVWDDRHDRDIKHGRREAWARLRDALHLALDEPNRRRGEPLVSGFADCVARLCGGAEQPVAQAVRRPLSRDDRRLRQGVP